MIIKTPSDLIKHILGMPDVANIDLLEFYEVATIIAKVKPSFTTRVKCCFSSDYLTEYTNRISKSVNHNLLTSDVSVKIVVVL